MLTSTKCVGGSRDKRSLIKTFATWTLACAKGLFQHLYWIFFWNHFSPTAGSYATLPGFRAAKASILVVACWRMIGGFFHGCYLNQSSFSGQFTPEPCHWPTVEQWPSEIWSCHWPITPCVDYNALGSCSEFTMWEYLVWCRSPHGIPHCPKWIMLTDTLRKFSGLTQRGGPDVTSSGPWQQKTIIYPIICILQTFWVILKDEVGKNFWWIPS